MKNELTPTLDDNAPALAGAIVYHAKTICETADHLWRVLSDVAIPADGLTDNRQQHKVSFDTEPMARVYIYRTIYDLAQSEVVDHLANRPALLKGLGLDKPPTQQNLSYAWDQFSEQTKITLDAAATGIALEARDHDVTPDALVPIDEGDDDEDEPTLSRAHVREHGTNVVELARRHGFGEFTSNRAENRIYEDEQILDPFATACLIQGSAYSDGEAGWFLELEHEGRDLYPDFRNAMTNPDIYAEDVVRFETMDHFGAFITESSHHLSEYLPYFRHSQTEVDRLVETSNYDPDEEAFEYSPVCWMPTGAYFEQWSARDPAGAFAPEEMNYSLDRSGEYAARIVHSIETGEPRRMNLNVPDDGRRIENLPNDALVEVQCHVDATGVHPCSVGDLPPQIAALNRSNVNVQSLAVVAALERDEDALRRAVKVDPLTAAVCTLEEVDDMVDDLHAANADYLPELRKAD